MKVKAVAIGLGITLGVGSSLAGSAYAGGGSTNDGGSGVAVRAIGGAAAPNARIAAFVQAGGSVVRSKGVAAVTHPATGVYCIDPATAGFNVNTAIPTLSVDWSTSLGDALLAHWRSANVGCPAGWFTVLTFDGEDGSFDLTDGASFTFIVP